MKFRKVVRKRALVVILMITMICQGIVPAYADTPDKHSESENVASGVISEEDSPMADEIVLASPDNAAYDSGKNEDVSIEEVFEEDPLSADGLILGTPINEEDDRLIIGSEGTVLRVPDNPKDIELVYSLEDDTYIGSTYSSEINQEYADKSVFVQLTLTPLDPQQIAFGSREQKVKIPLSDMLELDDRIYFSIEASNEMKLTNSEVKDNWEVELSLLISDDENTELEDLTDGEMFHREGYAQSGDDAFAFADSVLFTVENIKQTSFDPYSLLVVMAPQDTWWKSENYQRSDIDEIIFGQTPAADIKETWNADADNYGFIKCFITETTGDDSSYRTLYIARTVGNSSKIVANEDSSYMFGACGALWDGTYDAFDNLRELEISNLNTENVEDMDSMFYSCKKLERLDLSNFDTTHVTDMSEMFSHCESLEELDFSSFDTALVTTMNSMFYSCKSLKELDLSGFDTGNVTLMSYMFEYCTSLETIDLTGFDTSNVISMWFMFDHCESLKTIYSNDFDIGKVELGSPMFLYCSNLVGEKGTVYEIEFGIPEYAHIDGGESNPGYFTSKKSEPEESLKYTVTFDSNGHGTAPAQQQITAGGKIEKPNDLISEGYTFEGWYKEVSCENRWDFNTDVVNEDITLFAKWSRQTGIASGICGSCEWYIAEDESGWTKMTIRPINGIEGALEDWGENTPPWHEHASKVEKIFVEEKVFATTCSKMFGGFSNVMEAKLDNLDTKNVRNMSEMFLNFSAGRIGGMGRLDLSGFDTSNVTDMSLMFYNSYIDEPVLSSFDTRNVTNMGAMFADMTTKKLDLSSFDTRNVTNMGSMFSTCGGELILGSLNTSNVTNMGSMFYNCFADNLDLSNFDTSNVRNMSGMFGYCYATELDLSNFKTGKVTDMSSMFRGSEAIELDLKNFDTGNVINMAEMFENSSAKKLNISSFDTRNVIDMSYMFHGARVITELDLSSFDTSKVENMNSMFLGCHGLKKIIVDEFDPSIKSKDMFNFCIELVGGKGTIYDENHIDGEYARIDGGPSNPGYFTSAEEITDDLQITKFINPSGENTKRVEDGIPTYSFTVDNDVDEIKIDLEVTEGAEWELYNDKSCSILMGKDYSHSLSTRDNKWYIQITKNGEEKVYCLNIYRDPFVVYKPFIIDKDGFGFRNNRYSIIGPFLVGDYIIPFNSFKKVLGETRAQQIYDKKISKLEGFCYGFTQLANLFYLNPSLFFELYPEKSSVYEVKPGDPVKNIKDENNQESFDTKKLLELAWIYQFLEPVNRMGFEKINNDGDDNVAIDDCYAQGTNCLNEIIHHLESGEKIALVMQDKNSENESKAHSIYAFGYSETLDGYDIYIYDSNHPGKMQVLNVYRENSGCLSWRYNDTFGTKGDGYGFIYFDGIEISEEDFRGFTSSANGEWYKGKNESTDWYLYKTNNKELKMIRIGDGSPLKKEDMIPVTVLYADDNSSNSADGLYYIPEGEYEIQNDGQDGINISITSMDSGIWFDSEDIDNVVVDVEQDGSENEVIIKGNQGDRFKIRLTFDNDNVEYKEMILEGNLASSRAEAMNSGEEIRIKVSGL